MVEDPVLEELEVLEHPPSRARSRWPWALIAAGLIAITGLGLHAYSAYTTVDGISRGSKIASVNPLALFQDVATNGPRIGASVESSSRATYGRALEQFALDGTGVCLGIVLVAAGCFVVLNE